MSTEIGRYSRSLISTWKFNRVIEIVRNLELSRWTDHIGPVPGQTDRRIMIDLRRLDEQIQLDPEACDEFKESPARFLKSIESLILHPSNGKLDFSGCEILLIEEDSTDLS